MLGSSVWLQATVVTVADGGDEAILSDGSATFRAVQLRSAPGADRAAVTGESSHLIQEEKKNNVKI